MFFAHALRFSWFLFALTMLAAPFGWAADEEEEEEVYFGNGIKVGEVSDTAAIVWTRLTAVPDPVRPGTDFIISTRQQPIRFADFTDQELGPEGGYGNQLPKGVSLDQAAFAVPGRSGVVRLTYEEAGNPSTRKATGWLPVDPDRDYTRHFFLQNLKPDAPYALTVEARKSEASGQTTSLEGSFATAPSRTSARKVTFSVTTCMAFSTLDDGEKGQRIYAAMLQLKPDFFVHAGDIVYYDHKDPFVTHIDLARHKWNRMFGLSNLRTLLTRVPAYWMKDDHDTWDNDCWPTMTPEMGVFTFEEGKQVFDEQVPMSDPRHYRTFRWGKDLQIWMVEGRDFRSPNFFPDGPDKSIWGKEQVTWFKETVETSDATFKILISPTPMVGPDHLWKADRNDNHVDPGWQTEGNMLRDYMGRQKNMYLICGDRHWQYISQDPETGIIEYGAGASTDRHATPLANPHTSRHLYYKPDVGGFLSVTVERIRGTPTASFRHHGVTGEIYHEDIRVSME